MNLVKGILSHKGQDNKMLIGYQTVDGQWGEETYLWFCKQVKQLANALKDYGIQSDENVAIFSQNKPQWALADVAIMNVGAVSVPIYATNTLEQLQYILDETQARLIFVGDQEQYDRAVSFYKENTFLDKIVVINPKIIIKSSEHVVYFDDFIKNKSEEFETVDRLDEDLATIIYTSGTTGEPKGVMLTHEAFLHAFNIHAKRFKLDPSKEHSLCFLPLTHIFERAWTLFMLDQGIKVSFLNDPKTIVQELKKVKPTAMCAVPRFYEKAYNKIYTKLEEGGVFKRKLFYRAYEVGKKYHGLEREEKAIPAWLTMKYKIADRLIFSKIKNEFGGNLSFMPVGGASISKEITDFFFNIGMPFIVGYGLTETTATVACLTPQSMAGTVGQVMPETKVKIGKEDEILIKGKTLMKAYYKKAEETAAVFTEDGWFRSGDIGHFDTKGNLVITDRLKNLMKTSNGKYITPQPIESLLMNDNLIEHAMIIGDNRPFVTALIVPNFEALQNLAQKMELHFESIASFLQLEKVREFYQERLEKMQDKMANFEKIKRFELLTENFSMELGELTPTLKIKRKMILEKYEKLINNMYR